MMRKVIPPQFKSGMIPIPMGCLTALLILPLWLLSLPAILILARITRPNSDVVEKLATIENAHSSE